MSVSPSRRFLRNEEGAIALEFAIVAPVFFAIVFSIFEAGWMMTKVMMLEMALDKTVRELRVGRPESFSYDYVKERICDRALVYPNCREQLAVELLPIPVGTAFPSGPATCVDRGAVTQPPRVFDPGARSQFVFVRACAITDPLTPGLGVGLQLQKDEFGGYAIVTQSAFLNEPEAN